MIFRITFSNNILSSYVNADYITLILSGHFMDMTTAIMAIIATQRLL